MVGLMKAVVSGDLEQVQCHLLTASDWEKEKALVRAAEYGTYETVRLLVSSGVPATPEYPHVLSPLQKALRGCCGHLDHLHPVPEFVSRQFWVHMVRSTYLEIARFLLENGAATEAQDKPLLCYSYSHTKATRLLLQHGARPNAQNASGNTALHLAACSDNPEILEILLGAGADVNTAGLNGFTPLMAFATSDIKEDRCARILQEGGGHLGMEGMTEWAFVRVLYQQVSGDPMFNTLFQVFPDLKHLFCEAQEGGWCVTRSIISSRPAVAAVFAEYPVLWELFRPNPNVTDGWDEGAIASAIGLLVAQGARQYFENDVEDGPLPLICDAVFQNNLHLLQFLLDRGDSPNTTGSGGRTPLHYVSWTECKSDFIPGLQGWCEIASLLLEHGADVDARTDDGQTCFMTAICAGYSDRASFFVEHQADANVRANGGETALMLVAKQSPDEIGLSEEATEEDLVAAQERKIQRLLALGCDIRAVDEAGKTCYDHAIDTAKKHPDLKNLVAVVDRAMQEIRLK